MKKILDLRYKITLVFLMMMGAISSFAQDAANDPYALNVPKRMNPFYNGPLIYIIIGAVALLFVFIGYRYYMNNREEEIYHLPHHE